MFGFGKRNTQTQPQQPRQLPTGRPAAAIASGPPPVASASPASPDRSWASCNLAPVDGKVFPWAGDPQAFGACNVASANLANGLLSWVTRGGQVHADTYVATAGVIAGYAAQQSLRELDPSARLDVISTSSGEQFLSGEPLDAMLLAKTEAEACGRVWPRAAGAAAHAGMLMSRIPNVDDMFRHVAQSLGGPSEGLPSTGPKHQPLVPARQLLALAWPLVMQLFEAVDSERGWGPVPLKWRGAVAAYVTARPILDVRDVLDPAIGLTILMESAIYGSKLTRFSV
jgi:hypothetical protein